MSSANFVFPICILIVRLNITPSAHCTGVSVRVYEFTQNNNNYCFDSENWNSHNNKLFVTVSTTIIKNKYLFIARSNRLHIAYRIT